MIKKLMLIALLTCMPLSLVAQETSDDYELRSDEKNGWIIDKDGNKIEGIVRLMGSDESPWINQQKVKFIAKTAIDPSKKRQKLKTLEVTDLQGYAAYDNDVLREFESIKYTNVRESSTSDGQGIGGKIKLLKNLTKSDHMAETLIKGPVTVYRLYGFPASVAVGKNDVATMEADIKKIRSNPSILVSKKGKIEQLNSEDFKKLTEDCDFVRTKMLNKEYTSYNPEKEEKKRSKFGALLKNEMELDGEKIQKMAIEVLTDYNENCGKS